MRGCDVKGTSACQAADSMVGLDNLDASLWVVRQVGAPRDGESMPIPMETSSTGVLVSDTVSNVGQNTQELKDPPNFQAHTSPRFWSKHMK